MNGKDVEIRDVGVVVAVKISLAPKRSVVWVPVADRIKVIGQRIEIGNVNVTVKLCIATKVIGFMAVFMGRHAEPLAEVVMVQGTALIQIESRIRRYNGNS